MLPVPILGPEEEYILDARGLGDLPVHACNVLHIGLRRVYGEIAHLTHKVVLQVVVHQARSQWSVSPLTDSPAQRVISTNLVYEPFVRAVCASGVFVRRYDAEPNE